MSGHRPVLITGGAGFIGCNLADHLLCDGERVVLLDNLSRDGVERNYRWLAARHGAQVRLLKADVRDADAVCAAVRDASSVFHFAAQVAVTSSLEDPRLDFEVNTLGTLNVLEALRTANPEAPLLYTSTNKVYGCLPALALDVFDHRYQPAPAERSSLDETTPLDFASPYGCSKGAADQYVRDYARSFGLHAVVFRMSCIYGPRQMGTEDQGWVAHFLRKAMAGESVTIYGDGCQVRDLLYVDDLVRALYLARERHAKLAGNAFNIGGGVANAASVRDVLDLIAVLDGRAVETSCAEWRRGDQRYYVSDCSRFSSATGWNPSTSVRAGLWQLHAWMSQCRQPEELSAFSPLAA